MADWLGWLATLVVVISYFTRKPVTLRRIQALGACMWLTYGILIHSQPVIGANIFVAAAALISSWRGPAAEARAARG